MINNISYIIQYVPSTGLPKHIDNTSEDIFLYLSLLYYICF